MNFAISNTTLLIKDVKTASDSLPAVAEHGNFEAVTPDFIVKDNVFVNYTEVKQLVNHLVTLYVKLESLIPDWILPTALVSLGLLFRVAMHLQH